MSLISGSLTESEELDCSSDSARLIREIRFSASAESVTERLDAFIADKASGYSRSYLKKLIDDGFVTVDKLARKSSYRVSAGEEVVVILPPAESAIPQPENIPLEILYEDRDLIVINKPAGMTVHPGAGNQSATLVNALLYHCNDLSGIGGVERPGIVHRIDKDTSGVIVAAKNDAAHHWLSSLFQRHDIKRIYHAVVFGVMNGESGKISSLIGRDPSDRVKMSGRVNHGKEAVTRWKIVTAFSGISYLKIRLETGRTHQIRVHLSESGHPLLGDDLYGGLSRLNNLADTKLKKLVKDMGRQALHASVLGFVHPSTGEYMEFISELPDDMQRIINYLEARDGHDINTKDENNEEEA